MTRAAGAWRWALAVLGAALVGLALFPEPKARPLTGTEPWAGVPAEHAIRAGSIPPQFRHVRRSVLESPADRLHRTWGPKRGVIALDVASPPFRPEPYMSVAVTGSTRTHQGRVRVFLECDDGATLDVFRGDVNVNVNEAIVAPPRDWCPGMARLRLVSTEPHNNAGAGTVFGISALSYAKSSFAGRLPYFALALAIFLAIAWAGASATRRLAPRADPFVAALVALGGVALAAVYLTTALPPALRGWAGSALVAAAFAVLLAAGQEARASARRSLTAPALAWVVAAFGYFALLCAGSSGLGHWDANHRFWPGVWSSDNELPWIFADALRANWDLGALFGAWKPTDRPPLMTGAHLLAAGPFAALQTFNDGRYLRGHAYNAVSLTMNALWVPACWYVLERFRPRSTPRQRIAILALIACLPLTIFNTVYGWPKAFGAAFALASFGAMASPAAFLVLAALSMLAHASTALFLAPLGAYIAWIALRGREWRALGIGIAAAALLFGSWVAYKHVVLPSAEPVTRYALTGDFGFTSPTKELAGAVRERYAGLGWPGWIERKKTMVLQPFAPRSIEPVYMNVDSGTGPVDRLRAWDVLFLSKGNATLLVLLLAALALTARDALGRRAFAPEDAPFVGLVAVSLAAWALMLAGFLAPLVIPHWPQAALLGMALGSAALVQSRLAPLFALALAAALVYAGVVWIASPLAHALIVDVVAIAVFLGIAAGIAWVALRRGPSSG